MYEIIISEEISSGSKILAAISMRSKNFTTEKFNALIKFLKPYNATLLIADSLQRHNFNGEKGEKDAAKKARKLGTDLLTRCQAALKDAISIESLESWNEYKDKRDLKIIRWDAWKKIKQQELSSAFAYVESLEKEPAFNQSLQEVAENSIQQYAQARKVSREEIIESSINYQKEEIAYMLTFSVSEYDFLLYPELNKSQQFLYEYEQVQEKFRMPKYVSFTVEAHLENSRFFTTQKNSSDPKPPSLAGRQVVFLWQSYLNSSEVADSEKERIEKEIVKIMEDRRSKNLGSPSRSL